MQTINVHLGNMLTLFAAVSEEQPFRHQRELVVYVPCTEYRRFVRMIVQTGKQWLWLPNRTYIKALQSKSEDALAKLLYYDVYRGMLGELALSMMNGKFCTMISPKFDSVVAEINRENIHLVCHAKPECEEMQDRVRKDLQMFLKGSKFVATEYYISVFWYCVLLRTLAMTKNPERYEWNGGWEDANN